MYKINNHDHNGLGPKTKINISQKLFHDFNLIQIIAEIFMNKSLSRLKNINNDFDFCLCVIRRHRIEQLAK